MKVTIYISTLCNVTVPGVAKFEFSDDTKSIALFDEDGDRLAFFYGITGYIVEYV